VVFGGEVDDVPVVFQLVDTHFADGAQALPTHVRRRRKFRISVVDIKCACLALISKVTTPKYALGSDDTEIARLQTQAALIAEPTTLLLQRGGIRPGMRVLDLGSGPGDVAFQVAKMIGPNGSVVGVDQDPAQIAAAMQRRDEFGVANVDFRHGDARTFLDEQPFDAAVCRLLLVHLPDVVDVLAHHLRNLRPGGVFIAVDYDVAGMRALPEVELYSRLLEWLKAGFEYAHADVFVGMRFPLLFEQAGFRDVGTLGLQAYWPPRTSHAAAYLVGAVRAMKDAIVNSGVTTEEEIGLDTLEQRLGEALTSANAVFSLPTVVGGWGRCPE
jgi:SAM-dependent methyltransferase